MQESRRRCSSPACFPAPGPSGSPSRTGAAAGASVRRKGALLFSGAVLLALASTGPALGIDRFLFALVPLASIFRFAEKLIAPASLLFALAAALGADLALGGTRRAAVRLALAALLVGVGAAVAALWIGRSAPHLAQALAAHGKTHALLLATAFWREARAGLFDCAGLALVVALLALWRWSRQQAATPLAAVCCAASVFASCGGLLYSAPLAVVRGPFDLAERLQARAGPSRDRWRIFVNNKDPLSLSGLSARASVAASTSQALLPQFNSVARIEGMAPYFTASDPGYARGIIANPPTYFTLFGARFVLDRT